MQPRSLFYSVLKSAIPAGLLPLLMVAILLQTWPDTSWNHYLFHTFIEGVGSTAALFIAIFIIMLLQNRQIDRNCVWVAAAMIAMGLLDGFHSISNPDDSFVWLHALSTFVGGLLFSLVGLGVPQRQRTFWVIPALVFAIALTFGCLTWMNPHWAPPMLDAGGKFIPLPKLLNAFGGVGFIAAWWYFTYHNARQPRYEQILLANHSLLFGITGLIFGQSALWDSIWWFWHLLRVIAYVILLYYFFVFFHRQIQQQLQATQEAQQDRMRAEEATLLKDKFISLVSHDLKSPLCALNGFLGLMGREIYPAQLNLNSYLASSKKAIQRMSTLIDDLLKLERFKTGKLQPANTVFFLADFIDELVLQWEGMCQAKDLTIVVDIPPELQVTADHTLLAQVIHNLLNNAIKFSLKGQSIEIQWQQQHPAKLAITDHGIGIPIDIQVSLFRYDVTTSRRGTAGESGSGFGLPLSSDLMRAMGGDLGVQSKPGQGSAFFLFLPFYRSVTRPNVAAPELESASLESWG